MKDMLDAKPPRLPSHLLGEVLARAKATQNLLGAHRATAAGQNIAERHAQLRGSTDRGSDCIDLDAEALEGCGDICRRPRPCARRTRIAEHRRHGDVPEAWRAGNCIEERSDVHARKQTIADPGAASDQPVTPARHATD